MKQILFVHGMFQNSKSWNKWVEFFTARGYQCSAPSWPLHEGEPSDLRENPPAGLGELRLDAVIEHVLAHVRLLDKPIMIGHSVGGLITQIMLSRGLLSAGVAICPVAPNAMIDFDWGMLKNTTIITNPLKGNEPAFMDAKTFHGSFANSLSQTAAHAAYEQFATHDSRNVLRGSIGADGHVDLDQPHAPLLLIGAKEDQITPAELVEKNYRKYSDKHSLTAHKEFPNRSHYICGEPGWEEVAGQVAAWIESLQATR